MQRGILSPTKIFRALSFCLGLAGFFALFFANLPGDALTPGLNSILFGGIPKPLPSSLYTYAGASLRTITFSLGSTSGLSAFWDGHLKSIACYNRQLARPQ